LFDDRSKLISEPRCCDPRNPCSIPRQGKEDRPPPSCQSCRRGSIDDVSGMRCIYICIWQSLRVIFLRPLCMGGAMHEESHIDDDGRCHMEERDYFPWIVSSTRVSSFNLFYNPFVFALSLPNQLSFGQRIWLRRSSTLS
jgi:hypothetical protein